LSHPETPPRKVAIVTYYWPPSGGSGVQRWLKFAKYLDRLGWNVTVLTPENTSFTIQDTSLIADVPARIEVLRLPIWEPYSFFFRLSKWIGRSKPSQSDMIITGRKSLFQKISSWIRGNVFIPDPRRFWIKPAAAFLEDILRSNEIKTIITTGPPHSIHLIGLRLKKKNPGLRWIADFRDPWSEWDMLDTLSLTAFARARHRALERRVLTTADEVITIAPFHVARLEALSGRTVHLITNGFDEEDFSVIQRRRTAKFTVRHTGVVDELRDPRPLMDAIRSAFREDPSMADNVIVEFIGNVNAAFAREVTADPVLGPVTRFTGNIPHQKLLTLYGETDLQLLILAHTSIAPGNLPGKFFEYLASGSPILAVGPVDGDAAHILRQTAAGTIFSRNDIESITDSFIATYLAWRENEPVAKRDVSEFTRRQLTRQLIQLLESAHS
jgi:glycosyltransferase involved in cell wall biosynthesis